MIASESGESKMVECVYEQPPFLTVHTIKKLFVIEAGEYERG
jgi:hypothetical protein